MKSRMSRHTRRCFVSTRPRFLSGRPIPHRFQTDERFGLFAPYRARIPRAGVLGLATPGLLGVPAIEDAFLPRPDLLREQLPPIAAALRQGRLQRAGSRAKGSGAASDEPGANKTALHGPRNASVRASGAWTSTSTTCAAYRSGPPRPWTRTAWEAGVCAGSRWSTFMSWWRGNFARRVVYGGDLRQSRGGVEVVPWDRLLELPW